MLNITKLTPTFGAEISGLDLSQPMTDGVFDLVEMLWYKYSMLVFKDQTLSAEQHAEFGRRFAPEEQKQEGYVRLVSNLTEDGKPIGIFPNGELQFHSDRCSYKDPAIGTMLFAMKVPSVGGNTRFIDCYGAFEQLPRTVQVWLVAQTITNSYDYDNADNINVRADNIATELTTHSCSHPMVRMHPITKKSALYVNRLMTAKVDHMPIDESDKLLNMLFTFLENTPSLMYDHKWTVGDLILWDNRCMLHGRTDFDPKEERLLRKFTMAGELVIPVQRSYL